MKKLLLLISSIVTVQAADIDWFVQGSLGTGGDTLGHISYYNAPDAQIDAGDGFSLGVGLKFTPSKYSNFSHFSTALGVEVLYSDEDAFNGDITYLRYPVTLMEYYRYEHLRFGAGVSYHFNPRLYGDGFADNADMKLESNFAPEVEISYLFDAQTYLGLRYSGMEYRYHGSRIDASRIAFVVGVSIPSYHEERNDRKVKHLVDPKVLQWQEERVPLMGNAIDAKAIQHAKVLATKEPTSLSRPSTMGTTPVSHKESHSWVDGLVEISSFTTSDSESDERYRMGKEYVPRFVSQNMDTLAIEIASGQGETLDTLSSLLSVRDKASFSKRLKEHFVDIYHDKEVSSSEVSRKITALAKDL